MVAKLSVDKRCNSGYWLALLIATLPILAIYASGIPGLSIADIMLLVFFIKSLCSNSNRNIFLVSMSSLILGMMLIIFFDIFALFSLSINQMLDMIIRTVRYIFYVMCVLVAAKRDLNKLELIRLIKKIGMWATFFICFQYVLFRFGGYVVKGYVSFLRLYTEGYATREYVQSMFRPTSFFLEPAHYARYAAIAIVLYLFDRKNLSMKEFASALFISLGIIISTSSQGYVLLAFIWIGFVLRRTQTISNKTVKNCVTLLIFMSPILIYYIFRLPQVQATLWRSLQGDIYTRTSAVSSRMHGYIAYMDLPLIKKIFGVGFGIIPEGEWLNSAVYWLYGSGAIVFLVYLYFLISSIIKLQDLERIVLALYIILYFTDDSFYNFMCVIFLSLSLLQEKQNVCQGDDKIGKNTFVHCYRN